jgi:hypothetical protein
MKNNVYPENGSIVIVDDQIDEALPLMKALSKTGISFKYFNGKAEELPDGPLDNVRIVFLDIELEGMKGVIADKTKLSALSSVISKIVTTKCKPYIIIAWTKHQELVSDLNNYLKELSPLFTLCIDKSECKTEKDEFDIDKISTELIEKINEFGSFKFFLKWQNIGNKSSGKIINDISSIYPFDDNWNNNTNKLLAKLAEAYAGKQVDNENVWKYAMLSFNSLFLDIIESDIFTDNLDNDKNMDLPQQPDLDGINIIGEINRRLHISIENNNKPVPGNIYSSIANIGLDKENIIESIFNGDRNQFKEFKERENLIEESELIHLEVSPFCDYAQNKWKRSRILIGVKWPEKYEGNLKKADYIYKTPLFRIDGEIDGGLYYFVFDIRILTSIEIEELNNVTSIMRIRKELLNDIQTKIAGHINRLGITSL